MKGKKHIIAIDGPAGVGKSTVAKALASMLDYKHINTGSIYRAIAYKALKEGAKEKNRIIEIAKNTKIDFKVIGNNSCIIVDDINISNEISSPQIVPLTSEISAIPEVRESLLDLQRRLGKAGGVVLEGRDIGTNVFPDAEWKFYMDAEEWKRAERLNKVLDEEGKKQYPTKEALIQLVKETDHRDKNRKVAPLEMAEDAIYYDNTQSPTPEQDAVVLWYYITHKEEMLKNSILLKRKKQ